MKRKSFTLIEVVIYLAIFGIIFGSILFFALSYNTNIDNAVSLQKMNHFTSYVSNHISDSFKTAISIDFSNSVFDIDNGKLSILKSGGYLDYYLTSNNLIFDNNGSKTTLNNPDVQIEKFIIRRILSKNGTIKGVKVEMGVYYSKKTDLKMNMEEIYVIK